MRTWKQGVIGSIVLNNGTVVFIKCLKYPLAAFFKEYNLERNETKKELFHAFLDLSLLSYIQRLDDLIMTPTEKRLSMLFSIDSQTKKIILNNELKDVKNKLIKIEDVEDQIILFGGEYE